LCRTMYDKVVKSGAKALTGEKRNDKLREQCAAAHEYLDKVATGEPLDTVDADRIIKQVNGLPHSCTQAYDSLIAHLAKLEGAGCLDKALSICQELQQDWKPPTEWSVDLEQVRTLASLRRATNHGADQAVVFVAGWLDGLLACSQATDQSRMNTLELLERAPRSSLDLEGAETWMKLATVMQEITSNLRAAENAEVDACIQDILGASANLATWQSQLKEKTSATAQMKHVGLASILALTPFPVVAPNPCASVF
jgi:hypothetical protein